MESQLSLDAEDNRCRFRGEPPHCRWLDSEAQLKKAEYVRFFWLILRGIALTLALWTFIASLSAFSYGEKLNPFLPAIFLVTSYALMTTSPESLRDWLLLSLLFPGFASRADEHAMEGEGAEKARQRLPDWPIVIYCVVIGLGCSWACSFLWFSRRYSFVSGPVVGATVAIVALYGVIAVLAGLLTGGNWRTALLVFLLAPGMLGGIALRFHFLS